MRNTSNKASGFTLVESLVAMAIVATIALGGLGTMTYMRAVKNRSKEVCLAHVSGTVEKFRSIGYFAAVSNFTPFDGNSTFSVTSSSPVSMYGRGVSDSSMYPSSIQVLSYPSTSQPTLNNQVLITSSLNALLAIYNSNTAFCQTGAPFANTGANIPDGFGAASPELGPTATLRLQIVPYNTKTGVLDTSCPTSLKIAPPGRLEDDQPGASSAFLPAPPKVSRGAPKDKGLLLRVTQNYTDDDGSAQSCSIEQRFQYGADTSPPRQPDYKLMQRVSGPQKASSCSGNASTNSYRITFGYLNEDIEPGSVMVCRDTSMVSPPLASGYKNVSCQGNSLRPANTVPGIAVGSNDANPVPASDTGLSFSTYNVASSAPWVPCDKVTACGRAPQNPTQVGSAARPRYQLDYVNLPPLCRVYIQVAAIDTASNSSPTVITSSTGDATVPNISSSFDLIWDVPMPQCGVKCPPTIWHSTTYFYCSGSCP